MAPVRVNAALIVMLASGMLAGCQTPAFLDPTVPSSSESAFDRMSRMLSGPDTSPASQQALGDRLAEQALTRVRLADDDAMEDYLGKLANRIAHGTKAQPFDFKVYLVDDAKPNAFTPGGGHIFVTTGLVARLGTEGQMAMVLAHEIGHNAEAHIIKGSHRRSVGRRATVASRTVFDEKLGLSWVGEKIGSAINATVNLYTGDQEDAADEIGLDYMVAAGYHPDESILTIEALVRDTGSERASALDLGWNANKSRRLVRIKNLIVAKYRDRDFSHARRSTVDYDRLAVRYWQRARSLAAE